MQKIKKTAKKIMILFITVLTLLTLAAMTSNSVSALNVGDPIGEVLHTNIRTFINGHRIPSYNIGGWMVVSTEDLIRYGFDVTFDNFTRILNINHNPHKPFNPITIFNDWPTGRPGTFAFHHLHTEIRAFINGAPVRSFNVQGYLMILFEDLRDVGNFGTIVWDSPRDELRLTLVNPVTSILLNRTSASIRVHESISLTATVTPAIASDRTVTWSTANPNIAQVSSNGIVTGISAGTTVITATTANGMTATCTVTVQPVDHFPASITLDRTSATVNINSAITLHATVLPATAANRTVTWSSSNPSVATVNSNGVVTGVSAGTTVITATTVNGLTATSTVTVQLTDNFPTSITLDRTAATINIHSALTLHATVLPSNAANRTVTWSSSNHNVATVNSSGRVTGISAGTAVITATTANGLTATSVITVRHTDQFPTSITLDRTAATLNIHSSIILHATVFPSTATNRTVTWSSSSPHIAQVNSSGRVTGISAGTAVITAMTVNGLTATSVITVWHTDGFPASITLDRTSATLNIHSSITLHATVFPATAANRTVTWSSSNPHVAQVNSNGVVTGISAGTAVITATTVNGLTATSVITVWHTDHFPTSITLDRTAATLNINSSVTLHATVFPLNAANRTVTWSSSSPHVAQVSGNGVVTGISAGTAVITAMTVNGLTATSVITVQHTDNFPVLITLDRVAATMNVHSVIVLHATVLPPSPYTANRTVTWSSSNPSVATVDSHGVVTAISTGTAVITARTVNGLTATCIITVLP